MNASDKKCHRLEIKFTLIELLVVIAIIGILASMLMPSLQKSIATARANSCANNLKNVSLCYEMYFTDNNDKIPRCFIGSESWHFKIYPYIIKQTVTHNAIKNCGIWCSDVKSLGTNDAETYPHTGYELNAHLTGKNWIGSDLSQSYWYPSRLKISKAAKAILLAETFPSTTTGYSAVLYKYSQLSYVSYSISGSNSLSGLYLRFSHNLRSNYLFLDGHVKSYDYSSVIQDEDTIFRRTFKSDLYSGAW